MSGTSIDKKAGVNAVFETIKQILDDARANAYRAVNFSMVQAYWNIGRVIVEEEHKGKPRAEYGKRLIIELSKKLTKVFGKGFDKRNLWYMKDFYLTFQKVNALRSELTWTHYRLLLKVEKVEARNFYMLETVENSWSTRELERQINSLLFERLALSRERSQMQEGENEPIGIILCAEKNNAVVKFTLPEDKKQIFVSKYKLYLPTEDELKREILREKGAFEMEHHITDAATKI